MKALLTVGIGAMVLLAACGGGGADPSFTGIVSFGDSLSDVGSYRTAGVAALGGGQYTVNGSPSDDGSGPNWTEQVAVILELDAPCPARTGLESSGPLAALAQTVTDRGECSNYAQGGARVADPVGPWNKALLDLGDSSGYLGQLTEPVTAQVARHLSRHGGRFSGTELVTVWAGANDAFMQLVAMQAAVAAGTDPDQAGQAAVQAMASAATALSQLVRDEIVAKGARRVLVMNLPDLGLTPFARTQPPAVAALMTSMAQVFNDTLSAGLAHESSTLVADAFTASQSQAENPVDWGLANATEPACDPAKMAIPSALVCSTPSTVIPGDIGSYLFADDVHPTPYGHMLVGVLALLTMTEAEWIGPDWIISP